MSEERKEGGWAVGREIQAIHAPHSCAHIAFKFYPPTQPQYKRPSPSCLQLHTEDAPPRKHSWCKSRKRVGLPLGGWIFEIQGTFVEPLSWFTKREEYTSGGSVFYQTILDFRERLRLRCLIHLQTTALLTRNDPTTEELDSFPSSDSEGDTMSSINFTLSLPGLENPTTMCTFTYGRRPYVTRCIFRRFLPGSMALKQDRRGYIRKSEAGDMTGSYLRTARATRRLLYPCTADNCPLKDPETMNFSGNVIRDFHNSLFFATPRHLLLNERDPA
ncbi:hypothetical protein ARMSODRAFT_807525 [Armillaria solidipes]|uniref:Uncharacterized protein n=1 Tax=Armillaria solidipes TaxID=1076256 RepID=A0A2H3AZF6_9AGAR|nr:hypothetical protein ARMSODRAFT_807525 [Armillaria solidipes]